MRRLFTWLALLGLVAAACTDAGDPTTTTVIGPTPPTTSTTMPPQESTDADTAFFEAVQNPANLEWRDPAPGTGSNAPAFIHAVDAATGEEAWRLEVPWPQFPWLQLAEDRLIYSYQNVGEEDVVVAVGLDGAPLWQSTTNWRFHGPFYIDDEVLVGVARARDGNVRFPYAVVALDIEDGMLLWESKLVWPPESGELGSVAGGSGAVYVVRPNGRTIAYDIASGERRWSVKLTDRVSGVPLHVDGAVLVGTRRGLVALDAFDGSELWFADTGSQQIASPEAVASGNALAWLDNPRNPGFLVAAADVATGNAAWTRPSYLQYHVGETAVVGYEFDELRDYPSRVLIWSGDDGREIAAVDTNSNVNPFSVAIADRDVYVGTVGGPGEPGKLIAIDLAGGVAVWNTTLGGTLGPLATNLATVYVPIEQADEAQRGAVHAVARASGEVLWTFATDMDVTTHPRLADGLVFVVSAEVIPARL